MCTSCRQPVEFLAGLQIAHEISWGGLVREVEERLAQNCATCHGATGRGGNGGPDLTTIPSAKTLSVVINQVTNGGGGMPAFSGTLTQKQIDDVAAYVVQRITNKK